MNQQGPSPPPPKLPVNLSANPKLSSWLNFSTHGQVAVSPGKVEIGQGIVTALAQIAADELDVDISRLQMVRASTAASPNEGVTSGSLSVQQSGRALRHVCAEVRQIFLELASERDSRAAKSPAARAYAVQLRLEAMQLHRPRQWGRVFAGLPSL